MLISVSPESNEVPLANDRKKSVKTSNLERLGPGGVTNLLVSFSQCQHGVRERLRVSESNLHAKKDLKMNHNVPVLDILSTGYRKSVQDSLRTKVSACDSYTK